MERGRRTCVAEVGQLDLLDFEGSGSWLRMLELLTAVGFKAFNNGAVLHLQHEIYLATGLTESVLHLHCHGHICTHSRPSLAKRNGSSAKDCVAERVLVPHRHLQSLQLEDVTVDVRDHAVEVQPRSIGARVVLEWRSPDPVP
jgi:nucleotidyltransferase/DNA polymerase involved in DNA repair